MVEAMPVSSPSALKSVWMKWQTRFFVVVSTITIRKEITVLTPEASPKEKRGSFDVSASTY